VRNPRSYLPIVAVLVLLTCNQVHATPETGIDYSQSTATVTINTISTAAPNTLRSKTIACPADGFLVATANALFSFNVSDSSFPGTMAYSISRNSTAFDANHQHNVFGNYVFDFHRFPASMQRVDTCTAGQSFTYRFLATRGTNVFDVTARQPNLVILFFRDLL
jgi:hypothetical protein